MAPELGWALISGGFSLVALFYCWFWSWGDYYMTDEEYAAHCRNQAVIAIIYLAIYGLTMTLIPLGATWWVVSFGVAALILSTSLAIAVRKNPKRLGLTKYMPEWVLGYLVGASLIALVAGTINQTSMVNKVNDAQFDQTISYRLDADDKKMTGEAFNYPVTNLKINQDAGTYSWTERQADNSLEDKTITSNGNAKIEVTVLKDLDSKAAPRVEHQVTYKLNNSAIRSNGERVCVQEIQPGDATVFPTCNSIPRNTRESARFVKHHYIIHTPAGSIDKMVPATNE
jgi:hypothetical protein